MKFLCKGQINSQNHLIKNLEAMSRFTQEIIKHIPKFSGNHLFPEDFKFSSTFQNLIFFNLRNPIYFPKTLQSISNINFSDDFLFSFIPYNNEEKYFVFTSQNYFILIELSIFSKVYDSISEIFIKRKELSFIPLENANEIQLKSLLPDVQFKFTMINNEQKKMINSLYDKLFPSSEIANYPLLSKKILEVFSALIILSDSNLNVNSIQNALNGDMEFIFGQFYEAYKTNGDNKKEIDAALKHYLKSSEKNNTNSEVQIGLIYEKLGNTQEAVKWYTKAHNKNNPEGQYRLGLILLPDSNITDKEVIDYLVKSAENGNNVNSQMLLGELFNSKKPMSQRKIERNLAKSFKYFLMASANGNKEAYKKAQMLYKEDKDEVIYDTSTEIKFLTLCADNNSVEEQYKLGCIYEDDSITKRDINKAIYYLEKASDQNHAKSQIELALLLKKILKDKTKYDIKSIPALKLYNDDQSLKKKILGLLSLASRDNQEGQFNLGMTYLEDNDTFQAEYYFCLAAESDHAPSQYQVGVLFMKSDSGKRKVLNRAINYLTKASQNGFIDAYVKLGDIYSAEKSVYFDINKAIAAYEKGSKAGSAEAQTKLGKLYENDKSPMYNMEKAIKYYRLACENGNPTGLSELGRFYYNGVSGYLQQNYNLAYEHLIKSANMGDKYAQYYVGLMKYFGHGCIIDIPESIEWFTIASKNDDNLFTEPMLKLGLLYLNELKPSAHKSVSQYDFDYGAQFKDINKGVNWLHIASKKGNVEASNKLGKMYRKGLNVKKDINKSIEYYSDAGDRNDQKALYHLGLIYYEGKATTTLDDIDKAVEFLERIAKTGHIKARIKLAEIYTRPFPKVTSNENIASDKVATSNKYDLNSTNIYRSKYYTKENIAEALKTLAQFSDVFTNAKAILGELYYKGIQVKPNVNLAIKLLTEASQNGHAESMLFLGRIYYKGGNVVKDKNKAIDYLKQSANKQNVKAENKLGKIYFLDGDYSESIYWFTQASKHGYDAAQYNLGLFYLENRGTRFPKRASDAIQSLEIAATQNYLPALLKLGDYYYKGNYHNDDHFYYNIKKSLPNIENLKIAINYYKRAADLKSIKAMVKLGEIYERAYDYKLMFSKKESKKIAISYYEKAYSLGYDFYLKNHRSISKEEKNMLYKDRDYAFPAVKLALFQRNGEDVSCFDVNKALQILLEASRNDNVAAMNFFAKLWLYSDYSRSKNKDEAAKNREKAIDLFKKASKLGSKKAMIHLALYYFDQREYQLSFDYFNEVLVLNQKQHQNPKSYFDVDFEYDLVDNDYDLYAAFFCQLFVIICNDLSVNVRNCVINFVNHDELVKRENDNDIDSSFYEGLIDFNDFENDLYRLQYYNDNLFGLDDSILYKSFMRDTLCINNDFQKFFSKLSEIIDIFRHDSEFFNNHNDVINSLTKISYQKGNPKTALECAILLDDNVQNGNNSSYDYFTQLYKINLNVVLSSDVTKFNHSEFARSLYNFILNNFPATSLPKIRQITSVNLSNYLTPPERYLLIVPFAHNGYKFVIDKILEDYSSFTNIFNKKVPKFKIRNDSDDECDDFEYQYEFNSIDFNIPADRKKVQFTPNKLKINIIENMKHF